MPLRILSPIQWHWMEIISRRESNLGEYTIGVCIKYRSVTPAVPESHVHSIGEYRGGTSILGCTGRTVFHAIIFQWGILEPGEGGGGGVGVGQRLNYETSLFRTHLTSITCSLETRTGRGKGTIHFLKALFRTNSEINLSRPYLWSYL